jgi:hypothetical protein
MTDYLSTTEDLEAWDPPTICNGPEIVAPERRAVSFTGEPMAAVDRKLAPIAGLARRGMIRAKEPQRTYSSAGGLVRLRGGGSRADGRNHPGRG